MNDYCTPDDHLPDRDDPPESHFGPADDLASAWFDEGQEISENQPLNWHDSTRLADLAFLNALLERLHMRQGRTQEERIQRVIGAISEEEGRWTVATPASVIHSRTALRWTFSSVTAASVLLVLFGWYWISQVPPSAQAAVERAYRDAMQPRDRQYQVVTELRISTNHTMSIESQLTVRGNQKFTLRHPVQLGQCWIGSNGDVGWYVPAVGVPRTDDDPVIAMEWARKQGIGLPDLHVSALIDFLATRFDLELLPSEKLPDAGDVLWQRVRGIRREPQADRCQLVELWCHPRTGVAQKIVMQWDRKPGELGLASITLDLVREKQLPDRWYEAASHQPLPILPFPPIVPLIQN